MTSLCFIIRNMWRTRRSKPGFACHAGTRELQSGRISLCSLHTVSCQHLLFEFINLGVGIPSPSTLSLYSTISSEPHILASYYLRIDQSRSSPLKPSSRLSWNEPSGLTKLPDIMMHGPRMQWKPVTTHQVPLQGRPKQQVYFIRSALSANSIFSLTCSSAHLKSASSHFTVQEFSMSSC